MQSEASGFHMSWRARKFSFVPLGVARTSILALSATSPLADPSLEDPYNQSAGQYLQQDPDISTRISPLQARPSTSMWLALATWARLVPSP